MGQGWNRILVVVSTASIELDRSELTDAERYSCGGYVELMLLIQKE
ncbi:MAG: hypothetical protein CM1200mP41_25610 [Gammaproteobacteria bacterium]|nr:MAG: hypothetical protein CM1200mP41_25610 [Gammaproteobacteria bacterium]